MVIRAEHGRPRGLPACSSSRSTRARAIAAGRGRAPAGSRAPAAAGRERCGARPGGAGGTPVAKSASPSSRQLRSRRPRPRLRSAPRTTRSPATRSSRWAVWAARPAPPSQALPAGPAGRGARSRGASARPARGATPRAAPAAGAPAELDAPGVSEGRSDRIALPRSLRPVPFRMDGTYRRLRPSAWATSTMSVRGCNRGRNAPAARLAARPARRPARSRRIGRPPGPTTTSGASVVSRTRATTSASRPRPIHRFQLRMVSEPTARSETGGARSSATGSPTFARQASRRSRPASPCHGYHPDAGGAGVGAPPGVGHPRPLVHPPAGSPAVARPVARCSSSIVALDS